MINCRPAAVLGIFLALAAVCSGTQAPDARQSTVKVFASKSPPNPFRPWEVTPPQDVTGSGVIIDGGRILTNAHVVAYAQQVYVQPNGSPDKLDASVEYLAESCDLATLVLDDPAAISDRLPLPLAEGLPRLQAKVEVLGYPTGGDNLSVTEGVVSRIEYAAYRFGTSALRIQVDAAINPGNSGGPAIIDGEITGIVFSHIPSADNIGYLIPAEVIRHFLGDWQEDGDYDGFPRIDALGSPLENPSIRRYLGLDQEQTGIVVHKVFRQELAGVLEPWDVVTACDGVEIDNGGNVIIAEGVRVSWGYLISRKAPGELLHFDLIRKGTPMTVEVSTTTESDLLVQKMTGDRPTYFIYGGLVFSPVTSEMIYSLPQRALAAMAAGGSSLVKRMNDRRERPDDEIVVTCSPILPHKLTKGYNLGMLSVLQRVNGQEVHNIRQLIGLIKANTEPFLVFEFGDDGGGKIVLEPKLVERYTDQILRNNNIFSPCSDDLRDLWK